MLAYLRGWPGDDATHVQGAEFGAADWQRVLSWGRREYASVDMRGVREYGDECWDYGTSQVSCKHRIEFILNFLSFANVPWFPEEIRQISASSQF